MASREFVIGGVKFIGSSHEEARLRALHEQAIAEHKPPVEAPAPAAEAPADEKDEAESDAPHAKKAHAHHHLGGKKK